MVDAGCIDSGKYLIICRKMDESKYLMYGYKIFDEMYSMYLKVWK